MPLELKIAHGDSSEHFSSPKLICNRSQIENFVAILFEDFSVSIETENLIKSGAYLSSQTANCCFFYRIKS